MNQRTVIGGTVYESVGSNTSNLLLRCNGTARIQWGNKLIDLIKNGKLATNTPQFIFKIKDQSEIKSDGIYILETEEVQQIYICINGNHYTISTQDLYISASTKQDVTVDQRKQVLVNMGIYYNTVAELRDANITNGIVYVDELNKWFHIQDGTVSLIQTQVIANSVQELSNQEDLTRVESVYFIKGMITMMDNTQPIPEGWALCDGGNYTYNNSTVQTPIIKSDNEDIIFIMKL